MSTAVKKPFFIDGVKRNSVSHKILMITKFYRKPCSLEDMSVINPVFSKPGKNRIHRYLLKLEMAGLIYRHSSTQWMITPKGDSLLRRIATETRSLA